MKDVGWLAGLVPDDAASNAADSGVVRSFPTICLSHTMTLTNFTMMVKSPPATARLSPAARRTMIPAALIALA
jgi:hypothetical protein